MHHGLLDALPIAAYTTDAEGRLTFYNRKAAEFWGDRPELGLRPSYGAWRLFWPDGQPAGVDECRFMAPLAADETVPGEEILAEKPDGTRVAFRVSATPMHDDGGRVSGHIHTITDVTDRREAEIAAARLAAIVSSSDDAIVSKNLDGTITTWNEGAQRIFGYTAEELVGRSIRRIIPDDLQQQEDDILGRIRRGERIKPFDTVRLAKNGQPIDVSLTISPILDGSGKVIGASKIARDITERKRSEELQRLLFNELNHRVKNTLATIQAIASQSLRTAEGPEQFVASFNGRVNALASAHDLLVQQQMQGASISDLVRDQVALGRVEESRVTYSGPMVMLESRTTVQLALVLHELATNARKYGALSVPDGALSITWKVDMRDGRLLHLHWRESGVANLEAPRVRGFGTTLISRSLEANRGEVLLDFGANGVVCDIKLPLPDEIQFAYKDAAGRIESEIWMRERARSTYSGKRILIVEDEPLIAMELESTLASHGFEVVGPASHVESALRLISHERIDAALLDANLDGEPVVEVAAALSGKGVPFVFGTGFGRDGLPQGFRDAEIIAKPFDMDRLIDAVNRMLARSDQPTNVVPLKPKKKN